MNYEEWKRKRTWSFINFCIAEFSYGIGKTIYQPTEFYYFKDTMKVEHPAFSFGLSKGLFYLGGMFSLFITSIYYDRYNRIRHFFLISNIVAIIGNVLYLMVGQFLVGSVIGRAVISIAEVAMLYEPKELARRIGILSIFSSVGLALAPCTPFLFALVNVEVGGWRLNINNMAALVMAVFYSISLIISFFTLDDLSLVRNVKKGHSSLKEENKDRINKDTACEARTLLNKTKSDSELVDGQSVSESERKTRETSYLALMRLLLSNKLVVGVLLHSFLTNFSLIWGHLLAPIMAAEYLHWTPRDVAVMYIVGMVAGCVPSAIALSVFANRINNIDKLIFSSSLQVLFPLFYLVPFVEGRVSKEVISYVFITIGASFFYVSMYGSMTLLAKLVPPQIQASTEGFRYGVTLVACVIAGCTVVAPSTHELVSMATLMFFI